jgi:hypothetical protein
MCLIIILIKLTELQKDGYKKENNEVVHEEFPPYESILLNHRGTQVVASSIKKVSPTDENKNMDSIIQQNNYTNTYLKIIGEKLERIENQVNSVTIKPTNKEKDKPLFTPHEIPSHLQIPLKNDKNTALLEEISKRLETININKPSTSNRSTSNSKPPNNTQNNTTHPKIVATIGKHGISENSKFKEKIDNYIDNLQSQFQEMEINRVQRGQPSQTGRNIRNNHWLLNHKISISIALVTLFPKYFPQIGNFNLLIQIRTKNFMSSSLLTLIQFFFYIPPASLIISKLHFPNVSSNKSFPLSNGSISHKE